MRENMAKISNPSFFKRNLVTIIMIPSIIGIHYGWTFLQQNKTLVSPSEKIELPVITFAKYCLNKLTGKQSDSEKPASTVNGSE